MISTKTGDKGATALIGGSRVAKTDIRIETYGAIDELNSQLGLLDCELKDERSKANIFKVQHKMFNIGAYLATDRLKRQPPETARITSEELALLEKEIEHLESVLPAMTQFILPGGNRSAALAHICRTTCRRAERMIYHYDEHYQVDELIKAYMNRLSDYLFLIARNECFICGIDKIYWEAE